jgi:hypothetical protein
MPNPPCVIVSRYKPANLDGSRKNLSFSALPVCQTRVVVSNPLVIVSTTDALEVMRLLVAGEVKVKHTIKCSVIIGCFYIIFCSLNAMLENVSCSTQPMILRGVMVYYSIGALI